MSKIDVARYAAHCAIAMFPKVIYESRGRDSRVVTQSSYYRAATRKS
jgi:hypothetical protein